MTSTHGRGDEVTKSKRKGEGTRRKETNVQRRESWTSDSNMEKENTEEKDRRKGRNKHTEMTMFRRALGIEKTRTAESESSARRE